MKSEISHAGFPAQSSHEFFPIAKRAFAPFSFFAAPVAMPKNPRLVRLSFIESL
jgi:hypothetical protein